MKRIFQARLYAGQNELPPILDFSVIGATVTFVPCTEYALQIIHKDRKSVV